MTVVFVFDKKTGQSTQTLTQKIVWEDKVFETKQDWFSEMAKVSAQRADENMKVVRCE
jgi:adenine specific DNA methylase Mod